MAVEKAKIVQIMVDGYPGEDERVGCVDGCKKECYALGTLKVQADYSDIDSGRLMDAADNFLEAVEPQNPPPCLETLQKIAALREK